jgi:hypothetical protein
MLPQAGIDPAPERAASTWADFLRSQAHALLACDFFQTYALSGTRLYTALVSGTLALLQTSTRRSVRFGKC